MILDSSSSVSLGFELFLKATIVHKIAHWVKTGKASWYAEVVAISDIVAWNKDFHISNFHQIHMSQAQSNE